MFQVTRWGGALERQFEQKWCEKHEMTRWGGSLKDTWGRRPGTFLLLSAEVGEGVEGGKDAFCLST